MTGSEYPGRDTDKPNGPAVAVLLAAGIGIFVLGVLTTLDQAVDGIHTFLDGFDGDYGVGPLAGKTILGSAAFFLAWALFGLMWRRKEVNEKRMFLTGLVLGILGAILMFPPVFEAFA